jgi:hypothetical protein
MKTTVSAISCGSPRAPGDAGSKPIGHVPLSLGHRQGRADHAGRDRVDPDPVLGVIRCRRDGQADQCVLGTGVDGVLLEDRVHLDRRDIDNIAADPVVTGV